jgi:hypothetical protein
MRKAFGACVVALTLAAGTGTAAAQNPQQNSQQNPQQNSQQEKLNLSPAKEQAVKQSLANQSAHSVPGFNGQVGDKLPASERAQALPSDVQDQVPEAKRLLFVKLPDRIVLIDPDSQSVAEIVMSPDASTTGSAPAPTGSQQSR